MGSKRKPSPEEERPRLRLDEIARSGRMRIHDAQGVAAEQERVKSRSKKGLLKSLSKKAGKLKRAPKDDTDDEIRKLLESDEFGASKSRIRFAPLHKPGEKDAHDIGKLWSEQETRAKEDEKLEQSYKQAKEQAKKLKKQLLKNQIGDGVAVGLADKTSDIKSHITDLPLKLAALSRGKKQKRTTSPVSISTRPRTPGANSNSAEKLSQGLSVVRRGIMSKKVVAVFVVVLLTGVGIKALTGSSNSSNDSGTLGAKVTSSNLPTEKPKYNLLFPQGKNEKDYKVVRISPDGNAPAYAYVDVVNGVQVKITQQELPDQLKTDVDLGLEKVAKDFQATSIIQVDDKKIYHGYNEKSHVQSLIFVKNSRLIFIAAPEKIDDSIWAAFYLSLQ